VVDYHLPGRDGLTLTRKLARMPRPPQVLVFSAYADQRLELAALLAGADAVLSKNTLGLELCQQIGSLARGRTQHFSIEARALAAVSDELEVEDRPILGMLAAGTHPDEIIEVLGLSRDELESRRSAMLQRLKAPSRLSGAGTQTDRKE
jgi:DNA-binding NarL/FixJ family response regulator